MKNIGSIKIEGMEEQALTNDPQRKEQDLLEQQNELMPMSDWVKFVENMFESKVPKDDSV